MPPNPLHPASVRPLRARAPLRLRTALVASAVVHLALLAALNPGVRAPAPLVSELSARLAPAAEQPGAAAEAVATPHAVPAEPAPEPLPVPKAAAGEEAVGAPAQVPAETHYHPAHELDVYPRLVSPLPLGSARWLEGRLVRLELLIDSGGAVVEVRLPAAYRGAEGSAARALMQSARFEPARRAGRAVASRIDIELAYEPAAAR